MTVAAGAFEMAVEDDAGGEGAAFSTRLAVVAITGRATGVYKSSFKTGAVLEVKGQATAELERSYFGECEDRLSYLCRISR